MPADAPDRIDRTGASPAPAAMPADFHPVGGAGHPHAEPAADAPNDPAAAAARWKRHAGGRYYKPPEQQNVKPGAYAFAAPGKRAKRCRKRKTLEHYKIDDLLHPEHHAEFKRLLNDPRTRSYKLRQWLLERGCDVSFPTVNNYRNRWVERTQSVREVAEVARGFVDTARAGGAGDGLLGEAALTRLEQLQLQAMLRMQADTELTPRDWAALSRSVQDTLASREQLEAMRRDFAERSRRAVEEAEKADREREAAAARAADPRPDWLIEKEKAKENCKRVAERVGLALGLLPWPKPEPKET
jgi:hypothetical protein